jgi:hypothetical protein
VGRDRRNVLICREPRALEIAGIDLYDPGAAPAGGGGAQSSSLSGSVFVGTFCWIHGMCPDLGFLELGIALGGCFAVDAVFVDVVFIAVDACGR